MYTYMCNSTMDEFVVLPYEYSNKQHANDDSNAKFAPVVS